MSGNRKDIYYNEGALRLMEALGAVDEELLERCGEAPKSNENSEKNSGALESRIYRYRKNRKPLWKMGRAWAACLGLLAVGFITWNGLKLIAPHGTSADSTENASGGAMDQNQSSPADASTEGAVNEEKTEALTGTTGEAPPSENEGFDEFETSDDLGSAPDGDGAINQGAQSETRKESYTEETQVGSDTGIVSDTSAVKPATEEEARSWMPLGAYIPQSLPEGYRMENAYIDPEEPHVTMTWSRGMDHIMISVSSVEPGTMKTVDITKPETYDERLYEIPYAETVPREYRESVDNPVFDFSDMDYETGLELMKSRMISYDDAGDTDTPRGRFSILIEDEILLYFNGRGTPEEIWNMLYSMKR